MFHEWLSVLVFAVQYTQVYGLAPTSLHEWIKQDTLPESFFSVSVSNILRCGNFCERQGKCVSASFDVLKRICHLHATRATPTSTDCHGKYMLLIIQRETVNLHSRLNCSDDEIRIPSAECDGEKCRVIQFGENQTETDSLGTMAVMSNATTQFSTTIEVSNVTTGLSTMVAGSSATSQLNTEVAASNLTTQWSTVATVSNATTQLSTSVTVSNATTQFSTVETAPNATTQFSTKATTPNATTGDVMAVSNATTINPCNNNQTFNGTHCICDWPFTGISCETGPRDCNDVKKPTWLDIYPQDGKGKIKVYCSGHYLFAVVAKQYGFTSEYLNRTWSDYKHGFGNLKEGYAFDAYWLGNEYLHRITSGENSYRLNIYAHVAGVVVTGDYLNVSISNEANDYILTYDEYTTTDNVDQMLQVGRPFISFDRDVGDCAINKNTGFWFDENCTLVPPIFGTIRMAGKEVICTNFWATLLRT